MGDKTVLSRPCQRYEQAITAGRPHWTNNHDVINHVLGQSSDDNNSCCLLPMHY